MFSSTNTGTSKNYRYLQILLTEKRRSEVSIVQHFQDRYLLVFHTY